MMAQNVFMTPSLLLSTPFTIRATAEDLNTPIVHYDDFNFDRLPTHGGGHQRDDAVASGILQPQYHSEDDDNSDEENGRSSTLLLADQVEYFDESQLIVFEEERLQSNFHYELKNSFFLEHESMAAGVISNQTSTCSSPSGLYLDDTETIVCLPHETICQDESSSNGLPTSMGRPKLSLHFTNVLLGNESTVTTPDIVNDVIDLESQGFSRRNSICQDTNSTTDDLPALLDTNQEMAVVNEEEEDDTDEYEECEVEMEEVVPMERGGFFARTRRSSPITSDSDHDNDHSLQENDNDDDYVPLAGRRNRMRDSKRPRGRPAKPIRTHINPREIAHLPPEKRRYRVLRFKNNEASRKSRQIRKKRTVKMSTQCDQLEKENRYLAQILRTRNKMHQQIYNSIIACFK